MRADEDLQSPGTTRLDREWVGARNGCKHSMAGIRWISLSRMSKGKKVRRIGKVTNGMHSACRKMFWAAAVTGVKVVVHCEEWIPVGIKASCDHHDMRRDCECFW